jgi:hypothetical protein
MAVMGVVRFCGRHGGADQTQRRHCGKRQKKILHFLLLGVGDKRQSRVRAFVPVRIFVADNSRGWTEQTFIEQQTSKKSDGRR